MPYIPKERREGLKNATLTPETVGELNYLITTRILAEFIANPCYKTIHKLAKQYLDGSNLANVPFLPDHLVNEVATAKSLAFLEFYRRVGAIYEYHCSDNNGDLPEYQEALEVVNRKFTKLPF